jgi:hypothetical protein
MREDICTIPISEVFEPKDGCPICRMRDMLEDRVATYITGAAMMEPNVRIETNRLGFCERHFGMICERGSRLSIALILESHLKEIEETVLPKEGQAPGKKNMQAAETLSHSCFMCENIDKNINHLLETVIRLWQNEPDFRKLYSEQSCICLPHYQLLMGAASHMPKKNYVPFAAVTGDLASSYLREVEKDVTHFCRMFDYRNKDADWGNSKDAIERAIWFLTSRKAEKKGNDK